MSDEHGLNLAPRQHPTKREQDACPSCEEGGCMVAGTPPREIEASPDDSNECVVVPAEPEYNPKDVAFKSRTECQCVYISGPMTGDGTPEEMRRNVLAAWEIFKLLIDRGFSPLCPHFSGLVPDHGDLTREEWVANDLHWVGKADAMLRLHGDSDGADDEVLHASHCGIPVFSTVEQLEAWHRGQRRI